MTASATTCNAAASTQVLIFVCSKPKWAGDKPNRPLAPKLRVRTSRARWLRDYLLSSKTTTSVLERCISVCHRPRPDLGFYNLSNRAAEAVSV